MNLTVIELTGLCELLLAAVLAYQRSKAQLALKARTRLNTLRRLRESNRGRVKLIG